MAAVGAAVQIAVPGGAVTGLIGASSPPSAEAGFGGKAPVAVGSATVGDGTSSPPDEPPAAAPRCHVSRSDEVRIWHLIAFGRSRPDLTRPKP